MDVFLCVEWAELEDAEDCSAANNVGDDCRTARLRTSCTAGALLAGAMDLLLGPCRERFRLE